MLTTDTFANQPDTTLDASTIVKSVQNKSHLLLKEEVELIQGVSQHNSRDKLSIVEKPCLSNLRSSRTLNSVSFKDSPNKPIVSPLSSQEVNSQGVNSQRVLLQNNSLSPLYDVKASPE